MDSNYNKIDKTMTKILIFHKYIFIILRKTAKANFDTQKQEWFISNRKEKSNQIYLLLNNYLW